MSFQLAAVAPRLARARDEHNALVAERDRRHHLKVTKVVQYERLVAHRELQLLRACNTGNRAYIAARSRKLAAAERTRDFWRSYA